MTHLNFHKIGLGFCGIGLLLSFFIFIPMLRGIGIGIWPQSEMSIVTLMVSALLSTIGLFLLSIRSKLVFKLFNNPLVFIPFLIGFISVLFIPFHDIPMRSLLGSVRTGEGIVWWFTLSTFSASALLLWRIKLWRNALIWTAFVSFSICFLLSVTHKFFQHYYAPFYFPDYLAFQILSLLPIVYLYWSKKQKKILFYLPFYVVLNVLLYLTENKAMIGFGITAPLFFWGMWAIVKSKEKWLKFLTYSIITAIPFFWILLFLGISQINTQKGFYAFTDTGVFKTVASRAYLVDVSVNAQTTQPETFLTGHGWGTYVDHLTRYQPSQWLDFTNFKRAQWDGLTFDHFHSHNMFIEILNTIGIFGFVFLFLYLLSFAFFAKKSMKKPAILQSVGFMTWASFWFLLPIHLPFLVFAVASTCRSVNFIFLNKLSVLKKLLPLILLTIGSLQIINAFIVFSTASNTYDYKPTALKILQIKENCPMEYMDYGAGGLHLSRLMLDRLRYTVDLSDTETANTDKEGPNAIPNHVEHINHFFCQSSLYAQNHAPSSRLLIARLMTRGEILLALYDYIDDETRNYYYKGWKEELKEWLIQTPKRSDQATPYLLYHVIHGQEDASKDIVNLIYEQNPNDPIGLWFKGLSLLTSQKTSSQGLNMMRQALTLGIERFIIIEDDIRTMLSEVEQ